MKKILLLFVQIIILLSVGARNVYAAINLNYKELNLGVNGTQSLIATDDTSGTLSWSSSDNNVATVKNGLVTGISTGTTYIIVTNGTYTATCKVNVLSNFVAITGISLSQNSTTINVGDTKKINVTISPSNASNRNNINYSSSDSNIVTVDSTGTIVGKSVGTAYILISGDGRSTSYKVTVANKTNAGTSTNTNVALKGISTQSSIEIDENGTGKLTVTYNPSNATNKSVTWKSSNTEVVTVDSSGNLKAVSSGSATITVISNDGGYVATSKVTVNAIDKTLKGITLDKTEVTLDVGGTETLTVSYNPANADNKKIRWSSSNSKVASVTDGKITALKPGKADIKVVSSEGNYEAVCKVKVTSPPIEAIEFKEKEQEVIVGSTVTLETISTPEDSIIEDAIWTSSDPEVATIEDGVLKALKMGTTTITVSDKEEKITASTVVNVIAEPEENLMITIDGYDLKFNPDVKEYTLKINNESSLKITVNRDSNKVAIGGNRDLKNGSIITVTIKDDERVTYVINIQKKIDYTLYFIVAITVLLLVNIVRLLIKNKKNK